MIHIHWFQLVFVIGIVIGIYKTFSYEEHHGYGPDIGVIIWPVLTIFFVLLWGGIFIW